ncbi:MAG: EAL domain-containing protein, partial [Lachnospiraceae bacterium]|nr:EAL domain-containing protein [Lachnospiraceae bacterium]
MSKNYAFVFTMVLLAFTVLSNSRMERDVKKRFIQFMCLCVLQAVIEQAEVHYGNKDYGNLQRLLLSTAGYILRTALLYIIILIMMRRERAKTRALLCIPWAVFSLLMLINLFTGVIYSFNRDNKLITGPLFFVTVFVLVFYLVVIVWYSNRECARRKEAGSADSGSERNTIFISFAFIIINVVALGTIRTYENNSMIAMALSALAYGIYFKSLTQNEENELLKNTETRTGLLNEIALIRRINEMRSLGAVYDYAVVYFDLTRFGLINDQYGTEVGDKALVEYASLLTSIVRKDEVLSRQGSDKFIAVVHKKTLDLFLKQLSGLPVRVELNDRSYDLTIGATAGVYLMEDADKPGEEAVSNAYMALNYGKSVTKKSATYLTEELKNRLKDQKQFEMDIPIAMQNEEFVPYYQPKVDSQTGMLCGAEALVRWIHEGNLISPGRFIPVMENNDMMCDLDFYMLRHVCSDISAWIEQGLVPPTISVNFSRRNLSNGRLAEDIDAVVREYHVPKKMIEIEITETIDEFPISVLNSFVEDLHR